MPMHSMEYSEEEIKKQPDTICTEREKYPYGLRVDLEKEALKKLKMDRLPEVGKKMTLVALVEVISVSLSEHKGDELNKNVGLQITDMELKESKEDRSSESKLYGVPDDPTLKNPKNVGSEGL